MTTLFTPRTWTRQASTARSCVCQDPDLQAKAFANLETGTALFFWKYLRASVWHNTRFEVVPESDRPMTDAYKRCLEKMDKDWAFVDIVVAPKMLKSTNIAVQYGTIDKISIPGAIY